MPPRRAREKSDFVKLGSRGVRGPDLGPVPEKTKAVLPGQHFVERF
jgi:hypothetical protein